ncbi:MAG: metalloendopeptidase [Elusimicrobia bacterium]|nr:MAG: metalloendopeptidase [Elusimicrobiota bacterium]KAF0157027.1 MAG: metalloendopeptidase [Elusimicrobiota bacterium]
MTVRRAFEKDIPALAAIEAAWPGYPAWGEKGLREELANPSSVTLVAELDGSGRHLPRSVPGVLRPAGAPAGFINFWIVRPEAQINSLAVSAAFLRRGAARALLGKCAEYARKSACASITLEVGENNAPARALYAAAGFEVEGRRPKFYNNAEDALLMRRALSPGEKT